MSQRTRGISAAATHRLMARGIAAFALLLLIQASGALLAQTPFMARWWNAVFLLGFLAVFALAFILAMCGRETTVLVAVAAALVLLGYATWPLAAPAPLPSGSGPPWSWAMINVGAAWCAYAAGTRIAVAYTVLLGGVFAVVRASPTGGGAGFSAALQDALLATVMGLVIVMAIGILRQAAARSDAAAQHAVDEYRAAAHQGALRGERARFDALLHDSVMTVLLAASGLQAPGSRARNAQLARSAIERLGDGGRTAPGSRDVAPAELEARIRFANDTGHGTMALDVAPAAGDGTGIPAEVARARVRLLVIDDGKGFDPGAVPARRLGIKVSIAGRMESVGGRGRLESRPGRGTAVQLLWDASPEEGERA